MAALLNHQGHFAPHNQVLNQIFITYSNKIIVAGQKKKDLS